MKQLGFQHLVAKTFKLTYPGAFLPQQLPVEWKKLYDTQADGVKFF